MRYTKHAMPFGTALTPEGVRFRLWAPGAEWVELILGEDDRERVFPMNPLPDGWFELATPEAAAGTRYRFRLAGLDVPDPASRHNPDDVHGPSVVVDPERFSWADETWRGRPWHEAIIYEVHVGTFTPEGSFNALREKLDYLAGLGITALEIMPVADFPGQRNWGYDGVLLFAPDASYGTPEDFKALIAAAHGRGLMVFLDVVYNHFGPEGNYLHVYAKPFFSKRHHTPWGAAINFDDGDSSRTVRDFFIDNALFWLEEYRLDGLRLDAVHAIADDSRPDILEELAERVRTGPGRERHIHLILENDDNAARYLARSPEGLPKLYDAQWNDDFHHALHVLLARETDGYYADYAEAPLRHLGRAVTEGFAYQGEVSPFRDGRRRGEPSRDLPPAAFVPFLQNHDQVGNRAFGERLSQLAEPNALRAALAVLLLGPSPPLLFMGEEFAAETPFRYFCDFEPELAVAVTDGRRGEFARFERFASPDAREAIPDPSDPRTFLDSKLDWDELQKPRHAEWLWFCRHLLALRHRYIVPLLPHLAPGRAGFELLAGQGLRAVWPVRGGGALTLLANFGTAPIAGIARPEGRPLESSAPDGCAAVEAGWLPERYAAWYLPDREFPDA